MFTHLVQKIIIAATTKDMIKKIIILIVIISLPYAFCLADRPTEITYPDIPGTMTPVTTKTALPQYVKYVFNFFLSISGFICLISIFAGGMKYLTSVGNPTAQSSARSQIFNAFLGIIILLSSFLISNTINPELVIPYAGISPVGGVTFYENSDCSGDTYINVGTGNPDFGFQAKSLKFSSRPGELRIIVWSEKNYEGDRETFTSFREGCQSGINGRSVQFFWQLPGVYVCNKPYEGAGVDSSSWDCLGDERYIPADTALLEPGFNDNVYGLRFKDSVTEKWLDLDAPSDDVNRSRKECEQLREDTPGSWGVWEKTESGYFCTYKISAYGVVLHEHPDWKGMCELYFAPDRDLASGSEAETGENNIKQGTSSITLFTRDIYFNEENVPSKEGVWLCPDIDAERESCKGPFRDKIVSDVSSVGLTNASGPIQANGVSSIIIDGNYIAILFDGNEFTGTCQVFTENDPNFRDDPMGRCYCIAGNWGCSDCLSSFMVFPVKK